MPTKPKKAASSAKSGRTLAQTFPWILTITGFFGFLASFILTIDKFKLLANPSFVPECNINPIISCGSVMKTTQASAFGFANSFLGVAGFAAIMTIGVLMLASRSELKLKRWFWLGVEAGTIFGVVFIHWLIFQTIYRISALCPYCMVVWASMIPLFWYTTLYNLRNGVIKTPAALKGFVAFLQKHHGDVMLLWFLIILTMILTHFWYYWKTLL